MISCPEYALGIPGSFKNAFDWGSLNFPGKLVAIFNASPRASEAQAALRLVLTTMSARLVDGASISVQLLSKGMNAEAIATDSNNSGVLVKALRAFAVAIATGVATAIRFRCNEFPMPVPGRLRPKRLFDLASAFPCRHPNPAVASFRTHATQGFTLHYDKISIVPYENSENLADDDEKLAAYSPS